MGPGGVLRRIWPTMEVVLEEKNRSFHNQVRRIHGSHSGTSVSLCIDCALVFQERFGTYVLP